MSHPAFELPVKLFVASGDGDMGNVNDLDSPCRFALEIVERCFTLMFARGTFVDGTEQNNLDIRMDHRIVEPELAAYEDGVVTGSSVASAHDHILLTVANLGTGGKRLNMRVTTEELQYYTFFRDPESGRLDVCVFEWENPNTQRWAVEVGLVDTSEIFG